MSEGRVNEPSLSLARPDVPAIPNPLIAGSAMPVEVSDIAGFEIDRVPVVRTEQRNSCVRTSLACSDDPSGRRRAHQQQSHDDRKIITLHERPPTHMLLNGGTVVRDILIAKPAIAPASACVVLGERSIVLMCRPLRRTF